MIDHRNGSDPTSTACSDNYTSSACYIEIDEEEELPAEEEPFNLPGDDDIRPIRDYFDFTREPP